MWPAWSHNNRSSPVSNIYNQPERWADWVTAAPDSQLYYSLPGNWDRDHLPGRCQCCWRRASHPDPPLWWQPHPEAEFVCDGWEDCPDASSDERTATSKLWEGRGWEEPLTWVLCFNFRYLWQADNNNNHQTFTSRRSGGRCGDQQHLSPLPSAVLGLGPADAATCTSKMPGLCLVSNIILHSPGSRSSSRGWRTCGPDMTALSSPQTQPTNAFLFYVWMYSQ